VTPVSLSVVAQRVWSWPGRTRSGKGALWPTAAVRELSISSAYDAERFLPEILWRILVDRSALANRPGIDDAR
jgi:hypothetical protein